MLTEILPYLYVGRNQDALDEGQLLSNKFTHVLNVMDSCRTFENSKLIRLHVPISDFGDTDLETLLRKCSEFIDSAHCAGGKVLLHCARGQNRSPSVATGYLMISRQTPLNEAFYYVRNRRTEFAPHERYLEQLQRLDLKLFGALSLKEVDEPLSIQEIARRIAKDLAQE